jgi:hypothetical protein
MSCSQARREPIPARARTLCSFSPGGASVGAATRLRGRRAVVGREGLGGGAAGGGGGAGCGRDSAEGAGGAGCGRRPSSLEGAGFGRRPSSLEGAGFGRRPSTREGADFERRPSSLEGAGFGRRPSTREGADFERRPSTREGADFERRPSTRAGAGFERGPSNGVEAGVLGRGFADPVVSLCGRGALDLPVLSPRRGGSTRLDFVPAPGPDLGAPGGRPARLFSPADLGVRARGRRPSSPSPASCSPQPGGAGFRARGRAAGPGRTPLLLSRRPPALGWEEEPPPGRRFCGVMDGPSELDADWTAWNSTHEVATTSPERGGGHGGRPQAAMSPDGSTLPLRFLLPSSFTD